MGLRIRPGKTKILSNQSSLCSDTRKEMEVDDIKIEIQTRRKREILGPDDYFPATGDDRNQKPKSNQGCLGDVSQVQAGTDVEQLPAQTSTPAIRRSDNSDDMLRIGNMDTQKKSTRERYIRPNAKSSDSSYKRKRHQRL